MDMRTIQNLRTIYQNTLNDLNAILVGQNSAKKVIATSLLCNTNCRIMLAGNVGAGKSLLADSLRQNYTSKKISITEDLLPSDIQNILKQNTDIHFLQIDEFNRARPKTQSALIELLADNHMTLEDRDYKFGDFCVFATQNQSDGGTFTVPLAIYDRFDVYVYFEPLSREEKRKVLFGEKTSSSSMLNYNHFHYTENIVNSVPISDREQEFLLDIFEKVDQTEIDGKKLFVGDNIRAKQFAIQLAKTSALLNGTKVIRKSDIVPFIPYLFRHRINQDLFAIDDSQVIEAFTNLEKELIRSINVSSAPIRRRILRR